MSDQTPPEDLLDWLGISNAPNWRVAKPLGHLVAGLLTLLILIAFAAAFVLLVSTIFGSTANGAGSLGAGALIVAILGAPFLIWGTVIKQTTVNFQKESHITDRISKAVEQLGAEKTVKKNGEEETLPNIEVRIGGLLSLERIAQDSTRYDKGRDHVRVMEILCAYVRENAPAKDAIPFPLPDWKPLKDGATDEERKAHIAAREERFDNGPSLSEARRWAQALPKPRSDIQQTLGIIGRRTSMQRQFEARWGKDTKQTDTWVFDKHCPSLPDEPTEAPLSSESLKAYRTDLEAWKKHIAAYRGYQLDLRDTNLQGADLSNAIFAGAKLAGTRMEGANFTSARMEAANLSSARIVGADLHNARLEGSDISWASLEGALGMNTRFEGANLGSAQLDGATLFRARLAGANLHVAMLEGARLVGVRLEGASLSSARLEGASLASARLEGADLSSARLKEANLRRATLAETTNLAYASMSGASIKYVNETTLAKLKPFLDEMFGDGSIHLPEGVTRPAHWPDWELPDSGPNGFDTEWRKWQANPTAYTPPPKPTP